MIQTIEFKGTKYPEFQTNGNAARFCMPFALEVLSGLVFDICPNRAEWSFPNAILIDKTLDDEYHAMNLPPLQPDGIFCSHGLEHLERPFEALEYWAKTLKPSGTLFLYLPNMDTQIYHRPWSNKKHLTYFTPEIMRKYFEDSSEIWDKFFVSTGSDLYDSFTCIAQRK